MSNSILAPIKVADYTINTIFFLDICFNFMQAYPVDFENAYVVDRSRIATRYLSTWFFFDLISSVPVSTLTTVARGDLTTDDEGAQGGGFTQLSKVVRLLRLLRLLKVINISKYTQHLQATLGVNMYLLGVATAVGRVVLVAHFVACIFWGQVPWCPVSCACRT